MFPALGQNIAPYFSRAKPAAHRVVGSRAQCLAEKRISAAELDSLSSATANQVTFTANRRWRLGSSAADRPRQPSSASQRRTPPSTDAPATTRSVVAVAASGH